MAGVTGDDRGPAYGRIYVLSALLALAAAAVAAGLSDVAAPDPGAVPWLALVGAFALTEMFPVHLEQRREAVTLSLSTIPLVVGLFTVDPHRLVAARVIGAAIVLVIHRRQRPYKLALNLAMFAVESAVGATVFHALVPAGQVTLASWPGAFAAALSADLVATIVLVVAISTFQRRVEPGVLRSTMLGTGVAFVDTCGALLLVTLMNSEPAAVVLLACLIAPLVASYRLYSSLREQHGNLGRLHEFTTQMGGAVHADTVIPTLLASARELMHADRAWFRAPDETGGDLEEVLLLDDQRAMAAPLIGRGGRLGTLYVGERSGDIRPFGADDLRLFETLANHASVSLGNSRLVDQLREQAVTSTHQSLHDALTGLPNRLLFNRTLAERLERPGPAAVLLLDLDRFKEVNDTLGHPNGDLLLCEVGKRLRASLREGDMVARLGGDEFAILLPDIRGEESAVHVAQGVVRSLEQRFDVADVSLSIGVSIGIALSPAHGAEASKLLQRADVAMYLAKADQSGFELYDLARDDHTTSSLALVTDLRDAIDRREIEVHYQPQIDLRTGGVMGVEALARWSHPTRGSVAPDEFVATAETAGLIRPLTRLVLEQALDACAAWRAAGHLLRVSVNLSARSLLQPTLPEDVSGLLQAAGVPPAAVCLELTETSMLVEPRRAVEALHRLRQIGLTIAIDDFGTGHSSLAYLRELPVGEIKIDKSFVLGMVEDRFDEAIVCSIIDLARHLLVPVVAEGIEDAATAERLRAAGCAFGQGYTFSKALPAADLEAWLLQQEPSGALVRVAG